MRDVEYVTERRDYCKGDGSQESGGSGIKQDSSLLSSGNGTGGKEARRKGEGYTLTPNL